MDDPEANENSYTNETKEPQHKEISICAKTSVFFAILGVLLAGLIALLMAVDRLDNGSGLMFILLILAMLTSFIISTILSIRGIISIVRSKRQIAGIKRAIFGFLVSLVFWSFVVCMALSLKTAIDRALCQERLYQFRMTIYGMDYSEKERFPLTNEWCDSLLEDVGDWAFLCPKADDEKCSYALNKNVIGLEKSQLPDDIVLLFETDNGLWNQVGGKERLSTKNHKEGCNILFADGRVRFVNKEDFHTLRWEP